MDTNSYVTFLLIGTLLVVVDGQVIYRNGRRLLRQSAPSASAESLGADWWRCCSTSRCWACSRSCP